MTIDGVYIAEILIYGKKMRKKRFESFKWLQK